MQKLLLVFLLLPLSFQLSALPVIVKGSAPSCKGDFFVFYAYTDFITHNLKPIGKCKVEPDGSFIDTLEIEQTQLLILPLEALKGHFYIEPGETYILKLPEKKTKSKEQSLNPFFEEEEFSIPCEGDDSTRLNWKINEFDFIYEDYLSNNFQALYQHSYKSDVDTVIRNIEKLFCGDKNTYFNNYRKYQYAKLKHLAYQRDTRFVIRNDFLNQPLLYQNTAYMDLFNQIFENYFSMYGETKDGERLFSDIAYSKSPYRIKQTLKKNLALHNDTLIELIIIKGLHDAFYDKKFPDASLFQTLDSIIFLCKIPIHKEIAIQIKNKVTQLRVGFIAPQFDLPDFSGKIRNLSSFKEKYLYLNFCRSDNFSCLQDFVLLKKLYEKHSDKIEIVTICTDDEYEKLNRLFKAENYDWTLLYLDGKNEIIKKYHVKVYPTYYLIAPDGTLSFCPAPGPAENFEWHFFKLLQSKRRQ